MKEILAVVMPVYNGEKYIAETIDSILSQTFHDWNLIVVDDGSSDSTLSILYNYSLKDERIRIIKRTRLPKGAQTCRNIGLEQASNSTYIIFMDADDIAAPNCFMQRVTYMQKHPYFDFAVFPSRTFNCNKNEKLNMGNGIKVFEESDLQSFFWGEFPFIVWNNIYKRSSLIEKEITWDEKLLSLQDTDFNMRCILSNMNYEYANNVEVDFYYRYIQSGNAIHLKVFSKEHNESHLYLLNKIFNSLNEKQREEYELSIKNYILIFVNRFLASKNYTVVKTLVKMPWVKDKVWFWVRILMYYRVMTLLNVPYNSNKVFGILYPKIYMNRRRRKCYYKHFMESYFMQRY